MLKTLAAAEKVARYRHAQLSAVRLAGDINAGNNDDVTLDELLVTIKSELVKLWPHIGLDPTQLLLLQGAGERIGQVTVNGSEPEAERAAAPSVAGHGGLVGVELTALCRPVNVPCRSNAPATTAMRACARPNLPSARQRHDSGIVRGRLAAVWR